MNNRARFKVLVWHRKGHKTTLGINELVRWAASVPGTYWYVAPFYNQAKKIVWQDPQMLANYIPEEIWSKRNNSEMYVPFPNGSILHVLGADKPDSLRGPNPRGIVLDEYDDMRPEIWSAIILPIMAANPLAWCWFIGTYKGRKDLFAKHLFAIDHEGEWYTNVLKASESGIINKEELVKARENMPSILYDQEFECVAIDGASSYFRRIMENVMTPLAGMQPEYGHTYQNGADLAKYQDWTVITPFDLSTGYVGPQERFNNVDWMLQKARIEASSRRWNTARIVIDATGVGDPIVEDLQRQALPVEPVVFTETSRRQLLDHLCILLEQDKIKLPPDQGLIDELRSFQFRLPKTTSEFKTRDKLQVGVPEGQTDDRVMSLALAVKDFIAPIPVSARGESGQFSLYTQEYA